MTNTKEQNRINHNRQQKEYIMRKLLKRGNENELIEYINNRISSYKVGKKINLNRQIYLNNEFNNILFEISLYL